MFDKLSAAEERYEDLAAKLCDPGLVSDNALYRDTMREYKNLTPLVEKYREYKSAKQIEEESRTLLEEGIADKEFRELVESELSISEIGGAVGFVSSAHFSRIFRKMTGMTPSAYRLEYQTKNAEVD